jgi:acetyl-CoA acetyltransferase
MSDAFILRGVRTPVGRYGGSLSHVRTDDLLWQTMAAACEPVGVSLGRIARWGAPAAG